MGPGWHKRLIFGADLNRHADCPIRNLAVHSNSYEWIAMKFYGEVPGLKLKTPAITQ